MKKMNSNKMNLNKKTARIVDVLFLIVTITFGLTNQVLLGPIIFGPDFLTNISANTTQVIISMLLELIGSALAVGIAVMLFPILKDHSKNIAFWYLGFEIIDFTINAVSGISVLSLLTLSQEYVKAGSPDSSYFQILGILSHAKHWWTHLIGLLVSCFGPLMFYYLLYQSKLIPRFLSVWGLIGLPLSLTAILLAIFDQGIVMILFLPMGLNQLFLAIWLIVKGFNSSIIVPSQQK